MIKVSTPAFAAALKAVADTIHKSYPTMKAVRLIANAQDKFLALATFDGASASQAIIPLLECDNDATLHVEGAVLVALVAAMGGKGEITLSEKDGKLLLTSGGAKHTVNCVKDGDVPGVPATDLADLFTVTAADWRQLMRVSAFASSDSARVGLQVVFLQTLANGDQKFVGAVSADGFAAASKVVPAVTAIAGHKVSVPASFATMVSRHLESGDTVKVSTATDGKIVASITNQDASKHLVYASPSVAEAFPADGIVQLYQSAQSNGTTWSAPKEEIQRATRQVSAMGSPSIYLYANGSVRIASAETEAGQARTTLADTQTSGQVASKWLSASYVQKALDALASEQVTVKMETGTQKPIVLFDDGAGFTALIAGLNSDTEVKFEDEEEPVAVEIPQMAMFAGA